MKRLHGSHNKKVCDYLNLKCEERFNDWIVTTSFYSSIHFLDHALFPCKFEGKDYNNINEAHLDLRRGSKHQTRAVLLNKLLPKHKSEYEFLIEESQNARYSNYNVHEAIAQRAVRSLEAIIASYDKEKSKI
jgi:hypothetical protein